MNESLELIKKIGAGLVILVLVLMMGITFSSQPISEITAIIAGGSSIGEFRGKDLSNRLYFMVREGCKQRFAEYGEIPDIFIDQCASQEIRNYYVLPAVGEKLGLDVSDGYIDDQIIRNVKTQFNEQSRYADPDDRLSMKELYMREVQRVPVDIRKRAAHMELVVQNLGSFPYPETLSRSMLDASEIKVNMRLIQFDNAELLSGLGKQINVSEDMIRERYESKPAGEDGKKSDYKSSRELIENEIKNEIRQKALAEVKEKLGNLKEKSLSRIHEITAVSPVTVKGVALEELKQVRPVKGGNVILNLADPELLLNLNQSEKGVGFFGPIQSGERTVYVEILDVDLPARAPENRKIEVQNRQGSIKLASGLMEVLADHEAQKGGFYIKEIKVGK